MKITFKESRIVFRESLPKREDFDAVEERKNNKEVAIKERQKLTGRYQQKQHQNKTKLKRKR